MEHLAVVERLVVLAGLGAGAAELLEEHREPQVAQAPQAVLGVERLPEGIVVRVVAVRPDEVDRARQHPGSNPSCPAVEVHHAVAEAEGALVVDLAQRPPQGRGPSRRWSGGCSGRPSAASRCSPGRPPRRAASRRPLTPPGSAPAPSSAPRGRCTRSGRPGRRSRSSPPTCGRRGRRGSRRPPRPGRARGSVSSRLSAPASTVGGAGMKLGMKAKLRQQLSPMRRIWASSAGTCRGSKRAASHIRGPAGAGPVVDAEQEVGGVGDGEQWWHGCLSFPVARPYGAVGRGQGGSP